MEKIRGNTIILNGKPAAISAYRPDAAAGIYYEVIRIINGRLLFVEDHLLRLNSSCAQAASVCPDNPTLKQNLDLLLAREPIEDGNIKLVLFKRDDRIHVACFFVPHFYPSDEEYHTGVLTKTYAFERPDPTIKRWNEHFRQDVNRFIREEMIYEAILLNERGELTEGSRSNLFFIDKNDRIYTAPEKMILPGITRKYILQLCQSSNIEVIERAVPLKDTVLMNSCFISGTSPKVLPVARMDEYQFDPDNGVIRLLMNAYNKMILQDINSAL